MVLRTISEDMLRQGKELCATYIDYSAAFDSVSHKFIDQTLADAGASVKTRRIFRAIYNAAYAVVKVSGVNGKHSISDPFPIKRGVLQGACGIPPVDGRSIFAECEEQNIERPTPGSLLTGQWECLSLIHI